MDTIGDPGFVYHKTMAQVWALLILELADRQLLPFDLTVYAEAVRNYVDDLQTYATINGSKDGFNLTSLYQAADDFTKSSAEFHAWNKAWEDAVGQGYESSTSSRRPDALLHTYFCAFKQSSVRLCVEVGISS